MCTLTYDFTGLPFALHNAALSGADTAPNLMGRISLRKGWLVRGPWQSPGRRRQRAAGEKFFEDRLG